MSEQFFDEAQQCWPAIRDRKELLLRLAAVGREVIRQEGVKCSAAVRKTAGALTGVYRPDELERLPKDWPA